MAAAIQVECHPETMTKYLRGLGVAAPWGLVDVVGLDAAALGGVPRPALAVVLLYPRSGPLEPPRPERDAPPAADHKVFHLQQARANVGGAVALVHCVANNLHEIQLTDGPLKTYLQRATGLDSKARGALLEESSAIFDVYKNIESGAADGELSNHYVAFVHRDGVLYELDGRKAAPVPRGPSAPASLLQDAARVCREFVDRDPGNIGFSAVALAPTSAL